MKFQNPGAKALSHYRGLLSQGLKTLLPRINAGAPATLVNGQCRRYEYWLNDAAPGELAASREPELLAHAAECDACREAYNHARELRDSADQIDRGVESLVSGEPSPHFNSRLRARIAAEAASSRFNWLAWTPIAVGSIAFTVALLAFFLRTPHTNVPPTADNGIVRTVATRLPSGVPAPVISAGSRAPALASSHSRRARAMRPHRQPEVLVEHGQVDAIEQFADAVRAGHVDGEKLLAAQKQANAPLEIRPMEFVPLSPPQPDVSPDAAATAPESSSSR